MPKITPPRRISTAQAKVPKLLVAWFMGVIVGLATMVGKILGITSVGMGNKVGIEVGNKVGVMLRLDHNEVFLSIRLPGLTVGSDFDLPFLVRS